MQSSSTNVKISYFDKNKVLPHYESVKNTDAFLPAMERGIPESSHQSHTARLML
ncbi:hypothetical protein NT01EI_1161 [Edwardsiella ictaluri 93-146]|uniref:Uncharacterized protein n=2 Tax=Edwardsiella ictaluri TaxID=67780 RepID=C5BHM6_EDWI9|nr:hypothetical protein NT01EI_1161 [Edwardsiella ictaluri 93-146]